MNSNMIKLEQFGHLLLVYHFTVPLNDLNPNFMGDIFQLRLTNCRPSDKYKPKL